MISLDEFIRGLDEVLEKQREARDEMFVAQAQEHVQVSQHVNSARATDALISGAHELMHGHNHSSRVEGSSHGHHHSSHIEGSSHGHHHSSHIEGSSHGHHHVTGVGGSSHGHHHITGVEGSSHGHHHHHATVMGGLSSSAKVVDGEGTSASPDKHPVGGLPQDQPDGRPKGRGAGGAKAKAVYGKDMVMMDEDLRAQLTVLHDDVRRAMQVIKRTLAISLHSLHLNLTSSHLTSPHFTSPHLTPTT